jgi:Domain of unknown function (DUF4303)
VTLLGELGGTIDSFFAGVVACPGSLWGLRNHIWDVLCQNYDITLDFSDMYPELCDAITTEMLAVCRASVEKHAGEQFYSVALYTSGEYLDIADSIATTEGLTKVTKEYLQDKYYKKQWGTLEVGMRDLKWSPCDSPYHCEFENFVQTAQILNVIWQSVDEEADGAVLRTCQKIHEACIAALQRVRDAGIFRQDQVIFNLLMGDQSDEERLLNAESLNSPDMLKQLCSELDVNQATLESLRRDRWHN